VKALRHRGPDGSGLRELGPAVLGHSRLSIIDLTGGQQPMSDEHGNVWTVFNGEIWNHQRLRAELIAVGHRFASRCDTEVIVHGYEEWGPSVVDRLDGMFALAVWDCAGERLLLARDRMGKKPLSYALTPDGLAFGSDARAVLLASGMEARLDVESLPSFLFQRYVNAPHSLFAGIKRLAPGSMLLYDRSDLRESTYWEPPHGPTARASAGSVRSLLRESVRKRLMSDVPLGAFLSGGVDSAAVVGLMREAGADSIATFTIGFEDPVYDERPAASASARHFATEHHEVVVGHRDYLEALPRLAWYRDEPLAEPAEVPLLLLSEFAARSVKVVLSGEGGDELFGGYPKYRAERLLGLPTSLPRHLLLARSRLQARSPSHRMLDRAFQTLEIRERTLRWASWFRSFVPTEIASLLVPELVELATPERLTEPLRSRLARYEDTDVCRRMLVGDLLTYLPDNMLLRGDKVTMAASLEARMPLLDRDLVETVCRAPISQRASWRTPKRLLREALADVIPATATKGPKRGFPVPIARFLVGGKEGLVDDLLLSDRFNDRGLFRANAVRGLVDGARAGEPASEMKVFTLASLELWLRSNVDVVTVEPPAGLGEALAA
jgi:asparagine synthase (glutamine-hydrolysing)